MASAATAVRDALVGNFLGNLVQLLIDFFFLKTGWKKSPPTKIEEITRVTWSLRLGTLRKSHMPNRSDVQPPTTSTNPCGYREVAEKSHAAALLECCFRSNTVIFRMWEFSTKSFILVGRNSMVFCYIHVHI